MSTTKLPHAPLDCISRVRFAPIAGSSLLLVSSWDSHVRLYDAAAGRLMGLHKHSMAVLDCTFLLDTSRFLSVGLEKRLVTCDFQSQQELFIGEHDEAIKCVEFHAPTQQVFTGSWDRTLRSWDLRQPGKPVQYVSVGAKVFCMDTSTDRVVVGGSDRNVYIFDVRSMSMPLEKRESSLKHQIRTLQVGTDQKAFVSGSVEGRVALEYFDAEENQQSRYAFKCHRVKDGNDETIHPVNALAFHPVHGTFATGGSDGGVSVWDGYAKKRLWRLDPFSTSVSSLCFSADGGRLAVGVSYTFDQGEKVPAPANELVIRSVCDADMRPKGK